jgi:uridylate kinase
MDLTALTMCMEHEVPVVVFDFRRKGNIQRVLEGDSSVGTVVTN